LICYLAVIVLAAACDSTSTGSLAKRCDSLYNDLSSELIDAIGSHERGKPADEVIGRFTPRIERIATDIPALREDLADGGRRHNWAWPLVVMSESILQYEMILGNYPGMLPDMWSAEFEEESDESEWVDDFPEISEPLQPLAAVERRSFRDLKWFCNRVIAAKMPPISSAQQNSMWFAFMALEMALNDNQLYIMRAIQTDEELLAYETYLRAIGRSPLR
jgi:hypothetical protein